MKENQRYGLLREGTFEDKHKQNPRFVQTLILKAKAKKESLHRAKQEDLFGAFAPDDEDVGVTEVFDSVPDKAEFLEDQSIAGMRDRILPAIEEGVLSSVNLKKR